MNRPQVTILSLVSIVALAAVGFAAIRTGNATWAGILFSVTLFSLLAAPMGIIVGRGARRIYWSGFALLGWSYVVLISVPILYEHVGQRLLAPQLLDWLGENVEKFGWPAALYRSGSEPPFGEFARAEYTAAIQAFRGFRMMPMAGGVAVGGAAMDYPIQRIVIALEALLWAICGGWASRYFAPGPDGRLAGRIGPPAQGPINPIAVPEGSEK